MSHILFMFLGAGRLQSANYSFPSGAVYRSRYLFGLALLEELAKARPIDKLVVMGTSGSGWDVLIAEAAGEQAGLTELRERKEPKNAEDGITAGILSPFQEAVQLQLRNKGLAHETAFELVELAFEKAEQIELIDTVAHHVKPDDSISFDVTNGYRHFPLIGVMAAIVVKRVRAAKLAGIWYGSFEHPLNKAERGEERVAPAVRLDGLAELADWIEALAAFDADGNYARFAKLLKAGGIAHRAAEMLRVAGFREQIGNLRGAADKLSEFHRELDGQSPFGGVKLFLPALIERTAWAANTKPYSHFRALARASLKAEDLAKTARLAYEAAVTRIAHLYGRNRDVLDRDVRDEARRNFENGAPEDSVIAFKKLKTVRHILSHARDLVRQEQAFKVNDVLSDIQPCRNFLEKQIADLLPEDPQQPF